MTDKEILKLVRSDLSEWEIIKRLREANVPIERFCQVSNRDTNWFLIKAAVFTLIVCGGLIYLTLFVL